MTMKTFMEYCKLLLNLLTEVGQLLAIFQLTKLRQYLTAFPSHFNNIFLKYFRLFQNLSRNCMILQQLMRFHETNHISQNFSGITLDFCEVSKYFADFRFCFWYFLKMTAKFWFLSNRFKISKFHTFQWQKLKS